MKNQILAVAIIAALSGCATTVSETSATPGKKMNDKECVKKENAKCAPAPKAKVEAEVEDDWGDDDW